MLHPVCTLVRGGWSAVPTCRDRGAKVVRGKGSRRSGGGRAACVNLCMCNVVCCVLCVVWCVRACDVCVVLMCAPLLSVDVCFPDILFVDDC